MSFPHRHKLLFGIIVTMGVIVYIAFNLLVYRSATSGKVLKGDSLPKQGVTFTGFGSNLGTPPAKFREAGSGFAGQDPAPRDTPRPTGAGSYACDPLGNCNIYENLENIGCPKTFADSRCLYSCGDTSVRCPK